jgi:hypothetical protein
MNPKPLMDPIPEEENIPLDVKSKINELLWQLLPPTVTLGEADEIACGIHDCISNRWEKYHDQCSKEKKRG